MATRSPCPVRYSFAGPSSDAADLSAISSRSQDACQELLFNHVDFTEEGKGPPRVAKLVEALRSSPRLAQYVRSVATADETGPTAQELCLRHLHLMPSIKEANHVPWLDCHLAAPSSLVRPTLNDLTVSLLLPTRTHPTRWYDLGSLKTLDLSVVYGALDFDFVVRLIRAASPNLVSLELRFLGTTAVVNCESLLDLIATQFKALRALTFIVADCPTTIMPSNVLGRLRSLRFLELVHPELNLEAVLQTPHSKLAELAIGRHSLKAIAAQPSLLDPESGLGADFRAVCESRRNKPKRHPALRSVGLIDGVANVSFRLARFATSPAVKRVADELAAVGLELVDSGGRVLDTADWSSDEEPSSSEDDDWSDDDDDEGVGQGGTEDGTGGGSEPSEGNPH